MARGTRRPAAIDPTQLLHLPEGFPHADHAGAASRGVENHFREAPAELLEELVAHRFLTLDTIGLLECGNVEPSELGAELGHQATRVGNDTVHETDIGSIGFTFATLARGTSRGITM